MYFRGKFQIYTFCTEGNYKILSIFVESSNNRNLLDLQLIIKDILTRREGIVIPGLGSLVSRYQSAKIDHRQKVIHPPKKEICFNPNVTTDSDQVLANYIATKENITLSKAQSLIQNFVQNIRNELAQKRRFNLKGIGTLKKKENKVIELVPWEDSVSNLGFEQIPAEPLQQEKYRPTYKKIAYSPPPPTPQRSRRKTIVWITASTLLLIFIAGGYYVGLYDYLAYKVQDQQIFRNVIHSDTQENTLKEPETLAEDTALDTASVPKEIEQAINRMTNKKRALMYREPQDNKTYHIIAGSFRVRSNAQQYRNQLSKKGYTSEILENDSLFRISVKSFDKKEDALVELYQMRDEGNLKSIWLLAVQEKDH